MYTLEVEKRRNLSNQQHKTSTPHANAPGWNESLASESEATIKADRADPASTTELQEQTIEYVTSRYTPDDSRGPTTAKYARDAVDGPLGHAPGHEDGQGVYETVVKKIEKKTTQVIDNDSTKGYA
ncbi:hypothetical protein DXG01_003692 [Tephrocybe rancida]|nr:hypothetical protein DXG01_003692 [Tephrocybe rancida]